MEELENATTQSGTVAAVANRDFSHANLLKARQVWSLTKAEIGKAKRYGSAERIAAAEKAFAIAQRAMKAATAAATAAEAATAAATATPRYSLEEVEAAAAATSAVTATVIVTARLSSEATMIKKKAATKKKKTTIKKKAATKKKTTIKKKAATKKKTTIKKKAATKKKSISKTLNIDSTVTTAAPIPVMVLPKISSRVPAVPPRMAALAAATPDDDGPPQRTLNPITAQLSKRPSLVTAVMPWVVVPSSSSSSRSTTSTPTNMAATAAPPPSVFILPSMASTPPEKIVKKKQHQDSIQSVPMPPLPAVTTSTSTATVPSSSQSLSPPQQQQPQASSSSSSLSSDYLARLQSNLLQTLQYNAQQQQQQQHAVHHHKTTVATTEPTMSLPTSSPQPPSSLITSTRRIGLVRPFTKSSHDTTTNAATASPLLRPTHDLDPYNHSAETEDDEEYLSYEATLHRSTAATHSSSSTSSLTLAEIPAQACLRTSRFAGTTTTGTVPGSVVIPQPQSTASPPPPVLFSDHEIDEELLQWALLPDNEESNNNHAFSSSSFFIDHVFDPAEAATSSSSTMTTTASFAAAAVTASDIDTDTDPDIVSDTTTYFFYQAAILPSSLPNGLATIPETMRHLFDRVGSHKLKMMFPYKSQVEINQLLAQIWKRLCDEKLSEVLNLQVQRYKAHEDLRQQKWKKEKPNIKYRPNTADSRMIGMVCDSPTNPKLETITTKWVKGFDPYKNLQAKLVTAMYNSALPIASDVTDFEHTKIVHILHFPGEINTQKVVEGGLLWKAENGAIGEPCLRYPISKWTKLAALLGIDADPTAISNAFRGCVAFYDICPIIAFHKCGGSHNNATIRDFVTTILVEFVKRCRNVTHINVFGADPRVYVQETLKPILKSQVKNNLTYTFNNHPASFMMGGATLVDAQNFCKTGLVNLTLVLNMDPKTVAKYQERIDSDPNLVKTVIKTIRGEMTPEKLKKLQAHGRELGKKNGPINGPINGQATFVSKRGIFAEGGSGTTNFTPEEDELLVMYDRMFSLNKYKWYRIAKYMCSYNNNQCKHRMNTLLQRNHVGLIRNPTSLQERLQERKPLVTSYWRAPE